MKVLLVLVALAAVTAATAVGSTGPRVALEGRSPVVVRGVGFDRRAEVRVTVAAGTTHLVKVVRSSGAGTFSARWQTKVSGCVTVLINASDGHRHAAAKAAGSAKNCGAIGIPVEPLP